LKALSVSLPVTDHFKDPNTQSEFSPITGNVSEIEAGHQCYRFAADAIDEATEGTNATIQMEYFTTDEGSPGGRNQSFFACADVVSDSTALSSI
jgi:hypothetical protein